MLLRYLRVLNLIVLVFSLSLISKKVNAQCATFIDQSGDTLASPTYVNCMVGAAPANVTLTFQNATTLIHPYTINWGDGNTTNSIANLPAGSILTHNYTAAIDTYLITITQSTVPVCVSQLHFINERSVIAQIAPLLGSVTTVCAPGVIQFSNNSTNVSKTTIFELDYGDGSPVETFNFNNWMNTISHTYQRNTVNCNTVVTLTARNACTGSVLSTNTYGPIAIYDIDSAVIGVANPTRCYPDTTFTFSNNTVRNCVNDGNTAQRFERWRVQGPGIDTIIDWRPWPPSTPLTFNFPAPVRPISYTVSLIDSSFCGLDTAVRTITIIEPPIASFTAVDTICSGDAVAFTNTSSGTFNSSNWAFGDGATSTNTNPTHTYSNTTLSPITRTVRLIINNTTAATCRDTAFRNIVILPQPTARFIMNDEAINDNSVTGCDSIFVNFVDTSINASSYQWDFDNNGSVDFTGKNPGIRKFLASTTVRLRVLTANGCDHEITKTINIFRTPVAGFSVASVCVNQTASFTDTSRQFPGNNITSRIWNFGDPASGGANTSTLTNPTHVYNTPGIYTVRLIVNSANGCRDTVDQTLNVQFPPAINFTPSNLSGCSPLVLNLNNTTTGADPTQYVWKRNDTVFSSAISPSLTFINNKNTNDTIRIKLVAQTTFGCRDSLTRTIIVFPNPIAGFTANTLPTCNPSPINFLNTSSGSVSFNWDFGDGNTSNLPSPTHQYTNNSNQIMVYNARLIAQSANACRDTFTMPVIVYPNQTFSVNTNVDSGCTPLQVQFPSFPAIVSYQWDFGDAQSSTAASPSHTYQNFTANPIEYTARGILTNAFGCVDTVFKTIKVFPIVNTFFTSSNIAGCHPLNINFNNQSSGADSFKWVYGDGDSLLQNSLSTANHTFVNTGTEAINRTVILTAYSGDSCTNVFQRNITVYPLVRARFTIDTVECNPFIIQADNRSINANRYYWYVNNSLVDSVQNKEFTLTNNTNAAVEYDIRLQAISIYGCADDTVIRVRVLPSPEAQFITDVNSGCEPLEINFTNQSITGLNYFWDFGDGTNSNTSNVNFTKTYSNTGRAPLERIVKLVVQNADGCIDSLERTVTVFPFVNANFLLSDTVACSPLIAQVSNTSQNTINYAWFVDNVLVDTNANPLFNIANNTAIDRVVTIRLVASSAYGCVEEFTRTVRILPRPRADFLVSNPIIKFPLNTFNIVNQNIQAGLNYVWDFGDGNTSTNANPGTHTYVNPGTYTIQLVVFNAQCSDTLERIVVIEPPSPIVNFSGSGIGCAPFTLTFNNTTLYANRYEWDFGDGNTSNEENPSHTYTIPGTYSVRLIGIGDGGQDVLVHVDSVTVYEIPNAYFISQPRTVFIPSDPVVMFNLSTGANQFFWDFGDGFTSTEISPEHYYTAPGDYTIRLIARNEFGCLDTFRVTNAVRAEAGGTVRVPNAFTPNPNGSNGGFIIPGEFNNDVFHPVVQGADTYKLSIYNRWGELLFESNDVNIGWDGYYRGVLCKQDVYVWKVELGYSDGTKKIESGDLLLLR